MKLKTAFTVSLVVNAVLLTAVSYMLSMDVDNLRNEPLITSSQPAPSPQSPPKDVPAPEPDYASVNR
jgi:hypothetical protein